MAIRVWAEEVDLIRKLVDVELALRCQAIDDVIQRVYQVEPARHTDKAITEVKAAILDLVRSPLADLEAMLACVEVEPGEEPVEEVKPGEEAPPVEKPEPGKEPAKSKA